MELVYFLLTKVSGQNTSPENGVSHSTSSGWQMFSDKGRMFESCALLGCYATWMGIYRRLRAA
jgi:hypothetical protein